MRLKMGAFLRTLLIVFCLSPLTANSQPSPFQAEPTGIRSEVLSSYLANYEVYELDVEAFIDFVRSDADVHYVELELPGYGVFEFTIYPHEVRGPDYQLVVQDEDGKRVVAHDRAVKTFRGYTSEGKPVRFTLDEGFFRGTIYVKGEEIIIQSARFDLPEAPRTQLTVYRASEALEHGPFDCEPMYTPQHQDSEKTSAPDQSRSMMECREVEIAFANDWLMNQDHGGVTGVENHNLAVINDVQGNYDNEFADEFEFNVVEIFVSNCSSCDPWTSSTSSSALLNDFSNWGGSGFGANHDVAALWSDRNFNGSTIGLAWLDAVCVGGFKYNVCEDFTSNANFLRVLLAHELGHNFGSGHDASGSSTIMAPSISNVSVWSASSVNQINNYTNSVGCLTSCPVQAPPVAAFEADQVLLCPGDQVQFTDLSEGASEWSWLFPGGTPSQSSEQNPVVTYNSPGVYDVVLEVTNPVGDDVLSEFDLITVQEPAIAEFDYSTDALTALFSNFSDGDGTLTFNWDFGDGETSTDENPIHDYTTDGVYLVTLTVEGPCNIDIFQLDVEVISIPIAGFSTSTNEGCAPLEVFFENMSSDNVAEFLWEFEGGEPGFSEDSDPSVVYNDPGIYGVTLTVVNVSGQDILVMEDLIIVNPLPEAAFETFVDGTSVDFQNLSQNGTSYFWDFGDGNTSIDFVPVHEYQMGGQYTITLITENECGADTATTVVSIAGAPIAGFGVSVSEGCSPLEVEYSYTGGSGDVTQYDWSFPGGSPSTSSEESPLVTYASPGTYSAELIVTNQFGSDTVTVVSAVTVNEDVVANFEYLITSQTVSLENLSTGDSTILWIIDGVEYTEDDPVVNFGADGEYTVLLIASGTCGNDTMEVIINIATPPSAGVGIGSSVGCEPLTVQFTDQSSDNVISRMWSFPGGSPSQSSATNPVVVYETPGVYSVTLVVTNSAGSDEVILDDAITVDPLPEADFATEQTGTVINFTNLSLDADSYQWTFGDGSVSTENSPEHDYGAFGDFTVQLIATNNCGADTIEFVLSLTGLPIPDFSVGSTSGCAPYEVQFEDMSQNGATSWDWTFQGGTPATSTVQNPVVIYAEPGIYDVILKVSNEAGSQTVVREEYIIVDDIPEALFDAEVDGETATFTNSSLNAGSYMWLFGDGQSSTESEPEHVYPGTGVYTVTLIATNACGSDTSYVDVQIQTTAYEYPEWDTEFELWPNPNNGRFSLRMSEYTGPVQLTIYDSGGRVVHQEQFEAPGTTAFDLRQVLAGGVHLIRLTSNDKVKILRFVMD